MSSIASRCLGSLCAVFGLAGCPAPGAPVDARPVDDAARLDGAPVGLDVVGTDGDARPDAAPGTDATPPADTAPRADAVAPAALPIGEWTDAPGACPAGSTRVDITTVTQMEDATRGDAHPEGTCFFVHNGVYSQRGTTLLLYFRRGGTAGAPVTWVGESRAGVVIHGRGTFEAGDLVLANMTFDLAGYSQTGSFNTLTVFGDRVTISHVTLTGDCATGLRGGHIEVDGGAGGTLVEACVVERFGQCAGDGHLDHGIYLAAGHDVTVRNNVIRENSSRGIQLNTEGGTFGTLARVVIEQNRIYQNGHRDYEDGVVFNGRGTGDISDVTLRHNLFYRNYYSAVRFTGEVIRGVLVEHNTFVGDGMASSAPGRSEINLDVGTPAASVRGNIFVPARTVVNACAAGLSVTDNVVLGDAAGACVTGTLAADPRFVAAGTDDYRPTNPAATGHGAYAP